MTLRGVNIGPWDIFQNTLTQQDFLNLKALGIEYVKINCHLGNLVQDDGQGGWTWKTSYKSGESVIDTWTRYIQWASDAGLKVTPDISLYGEGISPWLNQSTFWDPAVYPLFASLWATLAETFKSIRNIVSFHILHVPGHAGTGNAQDWHQIITPTTIEAIRGVTNKRISWMPWLFGWGDVDGVKNHTGWYATGQPLPYPNIEYGFNHYANVISSGLTDLVSSRCEPYDGDITPLLWHLQPAIDFKNKFKVPMGCWEFGLRIDGCGGWPLQEPSRLLWIKDMLNLFQQNGFDWAYWNLAIPQGYGGTDWSIMNYDHTFRTELVNLLSEYAPTPISQQLKALIPLGVIAYLMRRG